MRQSSNAIDAAAFQRVFDALDGLQRVHSKASLDMQNLESVFGAFEMLDLFRGTDAADSASLSAAMTRLIVDTVESTLKFPVESHALRPPECLGKFAAALRAFFPPSSRDTLSVITFNYEVGLDVSLGDVHYALDGSESHDGLRCIEVLKLHGSTNWTRTQDGSQVLHFEATELFHNRLPVSGRKAASLRGRELLRKIPNGSGQPFIVPPTWSKMGHYRAIAPVWQRAANTLKRAEYIYVLGYSLPPSDQFFRLLYALGCSGPARLRRFHVLDPAEAVKERFMELLGPAARDRFKYTPSLFQDAVRTTDRWIGK